MYLRRYASDKLTELISSILDEAADVTEKTTEIKEKIGGIIETKKGDASQMMNDKITETLAASGTRPCSRPDCLWPPSFVARQVLAADGLGLTRNDMLAVSSGDVPVPEGVPGPDADEMKSGLEEMIKNIGEQVTRIAVSKMDTTTTTLIAVIGSVLDQLAVVRCLPAFLPARLPAFLPARPPACLPASAYLCSQLFRRSQSIDSFSSGSADDRMVLVRRRTRLRRARAVWMDLAT